jgi:hypothetical protein
MEVIGYGACFYANGNFLGTRLLELVGVRMNSLGSMCRHDKKAKK